MPEVTEGLYQKSPDACQKTPEVCKIVCQNTPYARGTPEGTGRPWGAPEGTSKHQQAPAGTRRHQNAPEPKRYQMTPEG